MSKKSPNNIKRVVFVQKFVPVYRLPLFEALKDKLAEHGIEFILLYGDPDPFYGSKIKMAYPNWGVKVNNRIIFILDRYIYWQGAIFKAKKGDIFICEHAARLLDNYPLFLAQQLSFIKLCYFGHGKNFQDNHEFRISAALKRMIVKRISKWFAYTRISAAALENQGVPSNKITVVNNTLINSVALSEKDIERSDFDFVYIGGLYDDKRLDFLLESSLLIKKQFPSFRLHIVGVGPELQKVLDYSERNAWCTYHGSLYGKDRERLLFKSSAILMPGAVGLVAIDSFHFATPIISTANGQHGPEIAYLEHEENYLTLPDLGTTEAYAKLVLRFLNDSTLSTKLRNNCRASADTYTIDNTANAFIEGILGLQNQ